MKAAAAFAQDVRFGLRLLGRQPGFTVVAALVLALGIGANTAVFSIVNALLLKPRPGHPNGLVVGVFSKDTAHPDSFRAFSYPNYVDMRAQTEIFASLAAHTFALAGITERDTTRRVFVDVVTANYFEMFGVPMELGRGFTADEERPGANIPVAVLSHSSWQRLGGRPDIVGETVRLNARDFRVVGIAPRGFGGSMVFVSPELFVPTGVYDSITNDFVREGLAADLADRRHHNLVLLARLQPGASIASVAPALDGLTRRMASAYPTENGEHALLLAPLSRLSVSTRPTDDSQLSGVMASLLTMAVVVLLVASFNLANMLLARAGARRKEFAIRLALGGSRARLVRQLLTEGFLLSVLGGAGGLLLSIWGTRLLLSALAPISPVSMSFDAMPDWRIFGATLAYCSLSTIFFGLLPARTLARTDATPALKDHAGELPGQRRARLSMPNTLVMTQLALSLVLLTVAGLFMRGATEAARADPGFPLERGILVQIDPSLAGADAARSRTVQNEVLAAVRARPDVASASLASIMPFGDMSSSIDVQLPGARLRRGEAGAETGLVSATLTSVSSSYFQTLERPLIAGRDFTAGEESTGGGARVAIIDAPLARRLFGDGNAIGRQFQYSPRGTETTTLVDIVGVAPGFRDSLFDLEPGPHVYFPLAQEFQSGAYLHVRTRAASADADAALLPSLRETLRKTDATLPILGMETRAMFRNRSLMLAVVRMGAAIFTVFGGVALLLAATGVYGVKAYVVARRTREIGIRMALGATPGRVVWMVVRDGLVASAAGIVVGLGLSAAAGVAMRSLTYQGRAADALVLGAAVVILGLATLLASWIPARRATRIAPIAALRG